jgi:hypothetical protein
VCFQEPTLGRVYSTTSAATLLKRGGRSRLVKRHELNCRATPTIAPGKSLAFAMRVPVPRNAPLGHNGLSWMLDPFGQQGPELNARVDVRR